MAASEVKVPPTTGWLPIRPERSRDIGAARRELHFGAQFASALGISFLPARPDDSHTNLTWLASSRLLASQPVAHAGGTIRAAIRPRDLTLVLLDDRGQEVAARAMTGKAPSALKEWMASQLNAVGLDGGRYTLDRHFEIPTRALGTDTPLSAEWAALEQLEAWFGNAAAVLEGVREEHDGADVRCWPHHFDIATLITIAPGRTVGVGMEPGDTYYDEPYFYVNVHPAPAANALTATLDGKGSWHTRDWVGAVLPGARLSADATEQRAQVNAFIASAVAACRALLR